MSYKLIKKYNISDEEKYEDIDKNIKNILTDFVNENFLKYNENQLYLLDLIYTVLTPFLKKYKLKLVYKGGNVMRLISNNLREYLSPIPNDIIYDVFRPFLQQSDNDFSIYINPNIKNYDKFINKISKELLHYLNSIRNFIKSEPEKFFYIFNLKEEKIENLFKKLQNKLHVREVKLKKIYDKKIISRNSNILIFDNIKNGKSFLYNSINTSLQFKNYRNEIIKFYLLRTKVNFILNNSKNVAGELIDISIPHKDDFIMKKLNTNQKYNKYIEKNFISHKNDEYNFTYTIINIDYIIKDLFKILFEQSEYPWENSKYIKRLARIIYFIFLNRLDKYKFSIKNLLIIKNQFAFFIEQLKRVKEISNKRQDLRPRYIYSLKILPKNNNKYLELIYKSSFNIYQRIDYKNKKFFTEYIKKLIFYSNAIIKISNSINDFFTGKTEIDQYNLYDLYIN